MERIEITITGELPEKGKHGVLDAAERSVDEFIGQFGDEHKIILTATVKAIRPSKKATPPASPVRAVAAE